MNTADLIASLSAEASPSKPMAAPGYWVARLIAVMVLYALAAQSLLGLRSDLLMQFTRPFFTLEILALSLLLLSSAFAAVITMYPDAYQKPRALKFPLVIFALLSLLLLLQFFMPEDALMVIPTGPNIHAMECAICIAALSLVPSAIILTLLRKGASVRLFQAGTFAVLCASAIGCLTLRLAENNDSIMHVVSWHYIPTLIFAAFGALAGRWLLRW